MQYATEFRPDWTAQTVCKPHRTRSAAEAYARRHSDGKACTVYVLAYEDLCDERAIGHKAFWGGVVDHTEGDYR